MKIPKRIKRIAVIIFIVFLGILSATLLPINTLNPITIPIANISPTKMGASTKYLAANRPDAIWVLSPNSLIKTVKNEAAKTVKNEAANGVLFKTSFLVFLEYNLMNAHTPKK